MSDEQRITAEKARSIGMRLGIDWVNVDLEQFRRGLEVALERASRDPRIDATKDHITLAGKIASAHPKEIRDSRARLDLFGAGARAQAETTGRQAIARKKNRSRSRGLHLEAALCLMGATLPSCVYSRGTHGLTEEHTECRAASRGREPGRSL